MGDEGWLLSVGIDCGSQDHHVCVLNRAGAVVAERRVEHAGGPLQDLAEWFLTLGPSDPSQIVIAIEMPHGPVVDTMLERGFQVCAINPKQLDRFRGRYSAAGAKDDRRDAWVLANAVQHDRSVFRALRPDDASIIHLRHLSRLDTELGEELIRTTNRLRDQLHRYYPQLLHLCPAADEPWLWQLLAVATTPAEGRQCQLADLERLLHQARIRRFSAAALHAVLAQPPVYVAPGTAEAASHYVRVLLPRLQLLYRQRRETRRDLAQQLALIARDSPGENREHHDITILLSLPGVGVRIVATMLAEAAQPLSVRDYHAVRTLSGLAPVTKASGKRRIITMRYACNHRLRTACYHWPRLALRSDVTARRHYDSLRHAGHSHARALRGVADRLLAVAIGMLKSDTLYDRRKRRAAA
jgi:transposase